MRGKQSGSGTMEEPCRAFDTKPSTTALESEPVSETDVSHWFVDKSLSTSLCTCSILSGQRSRQDVVSEKSEYRSSCARYSVWCVGEFIDKEGGMIVDKSLEEWQDSYAHLFAFTNVLVLPVKSEERRPSFPLIHTRNVGKARLPPLLVSNTRFSSTYNKQLEELNLYLHASCPRYR